MIDFIELEKNYHSLNHNLTLINSKRMKMLMIVEFLETNIEHLPPYVDRLVFELIQLIASSDFINTNLLFQYRLLSLCETLSIKYPHLLQEKYFNDGLNHLKTEINKVIKIISSSHDNLLQTKHRISYVWIPLVEKEKFIIKINPQFAILRKLIIDVGFHKMQKDEDEIIIHRHIKDEGQPGKDYQNPFNSAKKLVEKFTNIDKDKTLFIQCGFNEDLYIEGESLEAGLTALLFCELLHLYQNRIEFYINNNVAITGRIDEHGNLLPVDDEGLTLKIESCFSSQIKYLVVPKEQENICNWHLDKLNNSLSTININVHVNFKVVGVSNIEEIFYDRRLTSENKISLVTHASRKVWKARRPIAVVVFLLMIGIMLKMWYGPVDKNPNKIDVKGNNLLLLNSDGDILDKILFTEFDAKTIKAFLLENMISISSVIDVDGDSTNDIIFPSKDTHKGFGIINCYSVALKKYLWKDTLNYNLEFPNNPLTSLSFICAWLGVKDCDNDKISELYVVAANGEYPRCISRRDIRTGKEQEFYLNIGGAGNCKFIDVNRDGKLEIIFTGMTNAYNEAVVGVLNPFYLTGHSPLTEKYKVNNIPKATEMFYLRIPRTELSNFYKQGMVRNSAGYIYHDKPNTFRVAVSDVKFSDGCGGIIHITFDYNFNPVAINDDDFYRRVADSLYNAGTLKFPLDNKYFEKYRKTLLYWDGDGFVNHPAINKYYVKAVQNNSNKW